MTGPPNFVASALYAAAFKHGMKSEVFERFLAQYWRPSPPEGPVWIDGLDDLDNEALAEAGLVLTETGLEWLKDKPAEELDSRLLAQLPVGQKDKPAEELYCRLLAQLLVGQIDERAAKLFKAIETFQRQGKRPSVSAVCLVAKVHRQNLYKRHPELVELIKFCCNRIQPKSEK